MTLHRRTFALAMLLVVFASLMSAQTKRADVIWARTTSTPITLDGKLTEPDWAKAESLQIGYMKDNGLPGSGYTTDGWSVTPTDPVRATVKFLVNGDSLYVAVIVKDSSIGAGGWPGPFHWDGILSNMRKKSSPNRPVPNGEIFYAWCSEGWADPNTAIKGAVPACLGPYGGAQPRTDSADGLPKNKIWDARTFVQGTTNDDSSIDTGYVSEFKINLKFYGYDAKAVAGDIIMYSIAVCDADWQWFADSSKFRFSVSKAWAQGPWGGNNNNHLSVFVRPDVTTNSGAVPTIAPDLVIPDAGNYAAPVIDGKLDDAVWNNAKVGALKLQYGNSTYRNAYPNSTPYLSGQFQPTVNGATAAITDPNDATIKYFVKGDTLYLGFDVKDKVVQSVPNNMDRWDGFRVTMTARDAKNGDSVLVVRRLTFYIDSAGNASRQEDLAKGAWDSLGQAVTVKSWVNGTVDTMGTTPDVGYQAEMKINLRKFGYPAGRGDGVVFFGVTMFDGDSYGASTTKSYGSRVWFMRESDWNDGAAWMWMDPATVLSLNGNNAEVPQEFKLLGNYPNPFNPSTTIKFSLSKPSDVTLQVFNILGQLVATENLGVRIAGEQETTFNASKFASGVYTYRLKSADNQTLVGRMMLLK